MSSYSKTKSISKILIYFSLFAVLISGGVSYLSNNQIGADDDNQLVFALNSQGAIFGANLDGAKFTNNLEDFNDTYKDIIYHDSADSCSLIGQSSCFEVNPGVWTDPSVKDSDNLPVWSFIEQAYNYFSGTDKEIIGNIRSNYVAAAWNEWNEVLLPKSGEDNQIIIASEEFFKSLERNGVDIDNEQEEYCEPTGHCEIKIAKQGDSFNDFLSISLSDSYDGAKMNSLWLKGVDFVLGTAIPLWEGYGMDLDAEKEYLADPGGGHRDIYLSYANRRTANSEILYINSPSQFYLATDSSDAMQPQSFSIEAKLKNGNLSEEVATDKPYKIKVYIKPESKSSDDSAIFVGERQIDSEDVHHLNDIEYLFNWQDVIKKSYDPAPTDADDVSYDFAFPQKYKLATLLVEYTDEYPSGREMERAEVSFNTLLIKDGGAISRTTDYFDLDASPNQVEYNDTLNVDIAIANDPEKILNPPLEEMDKVDVWLCDGKLSTTSGESCPTKIGSAPADSPKTSLSWSVPEAQSIGYYTVMGKGFFDSVHVAAATGYEQVTISNTDPTLSEENPVDPRYSNLINFSEKASEDARGSSLTSVLQLANRIIDLLLYAIAILSVVGIIIGGIMYITSGGDPEKAKKGSKAVIYSIVGIVIAVLAFVIEYVVLDTLVRLGVVERL